jgi:DNA-binding FadR family transcriptional regulator
VVTVEPDNRRVAVFSPLQHGGRAEAVVDRLSRAIDLGLIANGEQLPSEVDLAAQLGISTVTLREALAVLRQQGLVETRRGRGGGSFVRSRSGSVAPRLRSRLTALSVHELRDIGDLLVAVGGAAARLAAQRSNAANMDRLDRLVAELSAATGIGARYRADARFHIELAAAAQSVRLTQAETQLRAEVGDLLWLPLPDEQNYHETAAEHHEQIAAAIRRRVYRAAQTMSGQHVQAVVERLIELHLRLTEA